MFILPGVMECLLAVQAIEEEKRFRDLLKTLPPDIAMDLRKKREAERLHEIEHQEKLEIANAGRARNFWGN